MPCHRDLDSVFAKNVAYRPKRRSLSARVHQARGRRACSVHLSRECSGRLTPFIKPKLKSRRNTNEIYRLAERGTRASQAADEQAVTNDSDGTPNPEGYDSKQQRTQAMVETAMYAACAGLASYLGTALRVEAYLGAFLPLPIVISAARWDTKTAAKTLGVTALLLVVLAGLQRAVSYVLLHGATALVLAALWSRRSPWRVTIPVASLVRSAGILVSLAISSWLLRENLLAMIAGQLSTLAEQIGGMIGMTGTPSLTWVYALLFGVLVMNSVTYLILLHVLYTLLLQPTAAPGFCEAPLFVQRILLGRRSVS